MYTKKELKQISSMYLTVREAKNIIETIEDLDKQTTIDKQVLEIAKKAYNRDTKELKESKLINKDIAKKLYIYNLMLQNNNKKMNKLNENSKEYKIKKDRELKLKNIIATIEKENNISRKDSFCFNMYLCSHASVQQAQREGTTLEHLIIAKNMSLYN